MPRIEFNGHDLLTETLRLLRESEKSLPNIAKESGVGFHWISRLHQGKIPDPGVNLVQKLYLFLSK